MDSIERRSAFDERSLSPGFCRPFRPQVLAPARNLLLRNAGETLGLILGIARTQIRVLGVASVTYAHVLVPPTQEFNLIGESMSDHEECAESYQECMASRRERVQRLIRENPGASRNELAALADVSSSTIANFRARNRDAVKPFTPQRLSPGSGPRARVTGKPEVITLADAGIDKNLAHRARARPVHGRVIRNPPEAPQLSPTLALPAPEKPPAPEPVRSPHTCETPPRVPKNTGGRESPSHGLPSR